MRLEFFDWRPGTPRLRIFFLVWLTLTFAEVIVIIIVFVTNLSLVWINPFIQCYVLVLIKFFELAIISLKASAFEVSLTKNCSTLAIPFTNFFLFWTECNPTMRLWRHIKLRQEVLVLGFRHGLHINFCLDRKFFWITIRDDRSLFFEFELLFFRDYSS